MSTLDALQETLAGEHAALYAYGVLGGRTSASGDPDLYATLQRGYAVHRAQRDQLTAVLVDLGVTPVAAEVAYSLPGPSATAAQVGATARELESRAQASYSALVARSVGDQRRWAITALTDSAVRVLGLGAEPETWPGIGEPTP